MKTLKLSWRLFHKCVEELADEFRAGSRKFDGIYGIPRGGLIPAIILSHRLGLRLLKKPTKKTLIIDDICDTGKTLKKYKHNTTAVLIERQDDFGGCGATFRCRVVEGPGWVLFPWENEKKIKEDQKQYVQNRSKK